MSRNSAGTGGGAVYGLGLIGSAVFFFQDADRFWEFVLAVPKAIVWPAIFAYEAFKSFYGG